MAVVGKQMQQSGFTMVELVIVIVITGILATVVAPLIQRPIESYQAMSRRAGLVDKADSALLRMDQELRNALPNSIRIGCSNQCLEFLHTQAGGRYRAQPVGDTLSFNPADTDTSFDILGPLANRVSVQTGSNAADCASNQSACLVIYNTGLAGSNAYLMENAATVTSIVAGTPLTMNFINSFSGGAVAFPYSSPDQRFYIVDTPISYICDTSGSVDTIRRYQGYNITSSQSAVDSHSELIALSNAAENALLVDGVSSCSFSFTPGTPTRNALIEITLELADSGEIITLMHQAHIVNLP